MSDLGIFIVIFASVVGFAAGWYKSASLFVASQALGQLGIRV